MATKRFNVAEETSDDGGRGGRQDGGGEEMVGRGRDERGRETKSESGRKGFPFFSLLGIKNQKKKISDPNIKLVHVFVYLYDPSSSSSSIIDLL